MLEELLKDLGARIGVGPLALGEDGACSLSFADGAEVHIRPDDDDPNSCVLVSACGGLPDAGRAAFLRQLLEANFFHRDTGDGVIALEPALDEALLVQRLRIDLLDGEKFAEAVTAFLDYQERWSRRATVALAAR